MSSKYDKVIEILEEEEYRRTDEYFYMENPWDSVDENEEILKQINEVIEILRKIEK